MADLKGFTERYGLNSRLVKQNGKLVEEVYKVGGRYDAQIRAVVGHLEAAQAVRHAVDERGAAPSWCSGIAPARTPTARPTTSPGWPTRPRRWTPSTASSRSTWTPRGVKGVVGGAGLLRQPPEDGRASRSWPTNAQWFEDRMPFAARSSASRGDRASPPRRSTSSSRPASPGPVTPIGINLPNDQTMREQHGSKSVSLVERHRGLRQVDRAGVPQASSPGRPRRWPAPASGARSPASCTPTCTR